MATEEAKKEIHRMADKKDIPWDDDPKFKNWSKKLTGKAHLDDMSPEQLAKLKKALAERGKDKVAGLGKAIAFLKGLPTDEAVVTAIGGIAGGPIPGTSVAALGAYKSGKNVIKLGPPGSAQRRMNLKLRQMAKADKDQAEWLDMVQGKGTWNLAKSAKVQAPQSHAIGLLSQKGRLSQDKKEEIARGSAFGVGFAAPIAAGRVGKKRMTGPFSGQSFEGVADLAKAARPGDLLMVGHAGSAVDIRKSIISLGTGLPHGYHAAIVGEVSKSKGTITIYDLTAKGYRRKEVPLNSIQHYSLFRPDSPKVAARARTNMMNLVKIQETLVAELKAQGMNDRAIKRVTDGMYQHKMNPVIGIRELFIPYVKDQTTANARTLRRTERSIRMLRFNATGIAKDIAAEWRSTGRIDTKLLDPMKNVCTNTAAMIGIPVGPASRAEWAGPNDFLRSGKLKNVGYRVSPRYRGFTRYFDTLLTASPHLIRAGVGLGLGSVLAGYVATHQWASKKRKKLRSKLKAKRIKRQIYVKGYTKSDGSVVKGYVKTATTTSTGLPAGISFDGLISALQQRTSELRQEVDPLRKDALPANKITRKHVEVVPVYEGIRSEAGGHVKWLMKRKDTGETIGSINTRGNTVSSSSLNEAYRGRGLGRKMYGEVARSMPDGILNSDRILSPNSTGIYKSFAKRDAGIKSKKPLLNLTLSDTRRNTRGTGFGEGYRTKLRSQYRLQAPKASLRNAAITGKIKQRFGEKVLSNAPLAMMAATLAAGGVAIKKDMDQLKKYRASRDKTAASLESIKTGSYQRGLDKAASVMNMISR